MLKKPIIITFAFVFAIAAIFLILKEKNANRQDLDKLEKSLGSDKILDLKSDLAPIEQNLSSRTDSKSQAGKETMPVLIDKNKGYEAILHTSLGDITLQLTASQTPLTVNNFVYLAKKNFYNDTIFHRVIKGFMIQGGDPKGNGTGGPGYTFADEPFTGEYKKGTLAMANSGPNTNGSQFFIMQKDYSLPKSYVIFGQVIAGIDVVDRIANSPVATDSATHELSKPIYPTIVKSVEILEK